MIEELKGEAGQEREKKGKRDAELVDVKGKLRRLRLILTRHGGRSRVEGLS